jgi:hypothetical protein
LKTRLSPPRSIATCRLTGPGRLSLIPLLSAGACFGQTAGAEHRPAILFCCPGENRYEYAGYDYMQALVRAGFTVDYIEGSAELTWDGVKNYNVLFVYDFPARGPDNLAGSSFLPQPPWLADY